MLLLLLLSATVWPNSLSTFSSDSQQAGRQTQPGWTAVQMPCSYIYWGRQWVNERTRARLKHEAQAPQQQLKQQQRQQQLRKYCNVDNKNNNWKRKPMPMRCCCYNFFGICVRFQQFVKRKQQQQQSKQIFRNAVEKAGDIESVERRRQKVSKKQHQQKWNILRGCNKEGGGWCWCVCSWLKEEARHGQW